MRAVGVPEDAIGIFGERGFNPSGTQGGTNVMGEGIDIDAAILNDIEGFEAWNNASLEARVDAVTAHEYAEFLGATHDQAVATAADSSLNISPAGRALLRADRVRRLGH
jgi:hypothetical protein